jgi:hypothetical protein
MKRNFSRIRGRHERIWEKKGTDLFLSLGHRELEPPPPLEGELPCAMLELIY